MCIRDRLELADNQAMIDIISSKDPVAEKAYLVGDSVVILGIVMQKPSELFGYKGSDKTIVFAGFPLMIEAVPGT